MKGTGAAAGLANCSRPSPGDNPALFAFASVETDIDGVQIMQSRDA